MSNDSLQIPQSIPFGDITESELDDLSALTGESPESLQAAGNEPQPATNPADVFERFFTPLGRIAVNGRALNAAANAAETAATVSQLLQGLAALESAVQIEDAPKRTKSGKAGGSSYRNAIAKLRAWLQNPSSKPPFPIFVKGNKKLPFWQFSALPGVTCPGAGSCLKKPDGSLGYCYSFKGWRNIYPYFRQLQNTLLLRVLGGDHLRRAWAALPQGTVVRLYVDGDIDSMSTLDFWMDLCHQRPDLQVYGYSKSWHLFIKRHKDRPNDWPSNYLLNISNSSVFWNVPAMREGIRQVPVVRGLFASIKTTTHMPALTVKQAKAGKSNKTLKGWLPHMRDVQAAAAEAGMTNWAPRGGQPFPCPGLCADCLPGGRHACGDPRMRNVSIVIGIH